MMVLEMTASFCLRSKEEEEQDRVLWLTCPGKITRRVMTSTLSAKA